MPGKDRTGPPGGGGKISGGGIGRGGGGRGRMGGNRPGSGPGGLCECPNCGTKVSHQRGVPCFDLVCPGCGTPMTKV